VQIAGYAQATTACPGRPQRVEGRGCEDGDDQGLRDGGPHAAGRERRRTARLLHRDGRIGTEVIGKAPYGQGAKYWVDGKAGVDGECGVNTSGGLIAKGHPVGATGVAMMAGRRGNCSAGCRRRCRSKNAKAAATFNIGGPICASVSRCQARA